MTALLYYTTEEVAGLLRISDRTVKSLAEQEKLPGGVKVGRQWRFDRARLEDYLGRKLPEPGGDVTQ